MTSAYLDRFLFLTGSEFLCELLEPDSVLALVESAHGQQCEEDCASPEN